MIKYRTIDGRCCESVKAALDYDIKYVKNKNTIMQDGYYSLYKVSSMDELVPLIYGKYKIKNLSCFPYYIIENKQTSELTLVTVEDLNEAIKMLITKRK